MLLFCPTCANTLTITRAATTPTYPTGQAVLECRTCPYRFRIQQRYYERREMKRKEVEDVIGGKESWENVDRADAQCPRDECPSSTAFFYQVQIRSADEPMTTFYKCTQCAQRWKEN
ncbi:DNA-directed RNA polymerase III subunit RPC10 [Usnea florida]